MREPGIGGWRFLCGRPPLGETDIGGSDVIAVTIQNHRNHLNRESYSSTPKSKFIYPDFERIILAFPYEIDFALEKTIIFTNDFTFLPDL